MQGSWWPFLSCSGRWNAEHTTSWGHQPAHITLAPCPHAATHAHTVREPGGLPAGCPRSLLALASVTDARSCGGSGADPTSDPESPLPW